MQGVKGSFGPGAVFGNVFQSKKKMQFGELVTPGLLG